MAKLYPPSIEGTIPAFGGNVLTIPFVMNKTTSWNEVKGFYIRIKSIANNSLVKGIKTEKYNEDNLEVYCEIPDGILKVGVSYKIQLAYIDKDDTIGYFSTVGVVKYTTKPEVTIEGLEKGQLHSNNGQYIGVYSQKNGDISEKLYSYCFTVYDQGGAVFDTTGEIIHNHERDAEVYESSDEYEINRTMQENVVYTIQYTGTTSNGMKIESPHYRIIQQSTVPPEIEANVVATMNQENGYVNISLLGYNDENGDELSAAGVFLLSRASSKDAYREWVDVERFALFGERPSTFKFKDFTVEHGYDYQYSLQQYNKEYKVYSNRMVSNIITASFDHSFLFDGERQLKIKYNPKVTSFKENVLESKTNTLGSKYPYFYRNGNVGYKEFPISGLISYLSDEEELFLSNAEMLLDDNDYKRKNTLSPNVTSNDIDYFNDLAMNVDANHAFQLQEAYKERERTGSQERVIGNGRFRTTNLVDYNIVAERTFKMKVLEFLNDGKPKLFRSPGEGNYLVRLMNSSLAPNDQLGRMIHTFSTTATEIDEFSYLKLGEYNLTHIIEPDTNQLRWKTYNIRDMINSLREQSDIGQNEFISLGHKNNIYSIQFTDMMPGDRIKLYYQNTSEGLDQYQEIRIGVTGAYFAQFDTPLYDVEIDAKIQQGQITFSTIGEQMLQFDTYRKINIADYPVKQFIGPQLEDIRGQMEDIKTQIVKYYFMNFTKRPIITVLESNNKYIINGKEYDKSERDWSDLDPLAIYLLNDKYYNGNLNESSEIKDYNCKIYINDKEIDITDTYDYQLIKPEMGIPSVTFGAGVVADISVQRREIEYSVEAEKKPYSNEYDYIQSRKDYEAAAKKLDILIRGVNENSEEYTDSFDTTQDYAYKYGQTMREMVETLTEISEDATLTDEERNKRLQETREFYESLLLMYEELREDKINGDINEINDKYQEALNELKAGVELKKKEYLTDVENRLRAEGVIE